MDSDPRQPSLDKLVIAVVVTALAVGAASGAKSPDPALPSTLIDPVDERAVELHPGAPVLHLVFFATWCPPCRDELPRLNEIVTRWGDRGYRLVVVAVPTRQSTRRVREFFDGAPFEGEYLFDAEGAAQKRFRADRLPLHVLMDDGGRIALRAPSLNEEVETTIERVMREHSRRTGN